MIRLLVLRRRSAEDPPRWAEYAYEPRDESETVATALLRLNDQHPDDPVRFECSCLQKKCGACAMVIDGRPSLACDVTLGRKKTVRIAPLTKFPVVADLLVDRSVMRENLIAMQLYRTREASLCEKSSEDAYASAKCLQCGLCLEVCPNFSAEGNFTGAAAAVPASRILSGEPERESLRTSWRRQVFEGCGKSLACEDICPAGIDTGQRMAQSNAVALWHRRKERE